MTTAEREKLLEYEYLLHKFSSGSINPKPFALKFLETFQEDSNLWEGEIYSTLQALFEEIDAYEEDPAIRDSDMIDERQLKVAADNALQKLSVLMHQAT